MIRPFSSRYFIVKIREIGSSELKLPLVIYDINGRKVLELLPSQNRTGLSYKLNSDIIASGLYFAKFKFLGRNLVEKFSVIK